MKLLRNILLGLITLPLLPLWLYMGIAWLIALLNVGVAICLSNSLNYSADLIDKLKQKK